MNGTMVKGHCLNSKSETYRGDGWVRVEVEVRGGERVTHKVEGQTVLEYEKPTIGGGAVSGFDPAVKKDGTLLTEGYITIQGESHPTDFRKIELLEPVRLHGSEVAEVQAGTTCTRTRGLQVAGSPVGRPVVHGRPHRPPDHRFHANHRPRHPRRLLRHRLRHRRLLLSAREDEQELLPGGPQRRLGRGRRVALRLEHLERALHRARGIGRELRARGRLVRVARRASCA